MSQVLLPPLMVLSSTLLLFICPVFSREPIFQSEPKKNALLNTVTEKEMPELEGKFDSVSVNPSTDELLVRPHNSDQVWMTSMRTFEQNHFQKNTGIRCTTNIQWTDTDHVMCEKPFALYSRRIIRKADDKEQIHYQFKQINPNFMNQFVPWMDNIQFVTKNWYISRINQGYTFVNKHDLHHEQINPSSVWIPEKPIGIIQDAGLVSDKIAVKYGEEFRVISVGSSNTNNNGLIIQGGSVILPSDEITSVTEITFNQDHSLIAMYDYYGWLEPGQTRDLTWYRTDNGNLLKKVKGYIYNSGFTMKDACWLNRRQFVVNVSSLSQLALYHWDLPPPKFMNRASLSSLDSRFKPYCSLHGDSVILHFYSGKVKKASISWP